MTSNLYNEMDMEQFLLNYRNESIIYIENSGNAGDSLIAHGTWLLFDKLKLNYTMGTYSSKYKNKTLFFAGGGSLVGLYEKCRIFLENNINNNNKIVLLPHTIANEDALIKKLDKNVIIFCREKASYDYVYKLMEMKNNLYLSKDMAFYIDKLDKLDKYANVVGVGELNCYRTDKEKTDIILPPDNIDLSVTLKKKPALINDRKKNDKVVASIFEYISKYEIINTNRLHMAIAACLLNKKVRFYSNSYYKNKAMYDYCLTNFKNLEFIS